MAETIRALIVEDSEDDANLLVYELEKGNLRLTHERVDDIKGLETALKNAEWDIILCDYSIPGFGALPALRYLTDNGIDLPIIVLSGVVGEDTAVSVMKAGAHDFIVKGSYSRLVPAILRELSDFRERRARAEEVSRQTREVEKQRQLAYTMVMQNPQPLLIMNKKLNIKLANEAFHTMSGITKEQLTSMSAHDFNVIEKSGHGIKEALETKEGVTGDIVVKFPSGIHYLEQHTVPLLDTDGMIVSIMAVYNDNTEKRERDIKAGELAHYTTEYLGVLSQNLRHLAEGDLDFNLHIKESTEPTREARLEFLRINDNLKEVKEALERLNDDANTLSKAAVEGRLEIRADASRHQGGYRKIIEGVNVTLDSVIGPLNIAADYVDKISRGTIPEKITETMNGDFNILKNNLNECVGNINALIADAHHLAGAAVEGRLATRADLTRHQGDYKKIIDGLNKTLDSVVNPLKVTGDYIDRIGRGDIPEKITDTYLGDFNDLKNSINHCIEGLQAIVECNVVLGRLSRNDHSEKVEGRYVGIYANMAKSTNEVRERLLGVTKQINEIALGDTRELPDLRRIGKRSEEDHLLPAIIECLEAIELLINDTGMLARAADKGDLNVRADTSRHKGEYRKIVEGINTTLDSVTGPVNEALRVSKEFSETNFSARFNPSLKVDGDWIVFKEALNHIGVSVSLTVNKINQQVLDLASSAQEANASVEEVISGASQVAKNAAGVSTNAERGGENARQVLKAMEDLSATVQDVATKTETVSKLAIDANNLSKKGADLAKRADTGMTGITRNAADVEAIVTDIAGEMERISKIVGLISDLASQTNLLALNAAIEAARAGDAGRGFAVVATEVKSLAQESRASAENIAEMIGALERKTKAAADAAADAGKTVKEGSVALSETLDAFNQIVRSIGEITRNVEDVASSSEEQAATVQEITASVTELTGAIQGTAREAVDAAAASEEASAAIDQIGKIIGNVTLIVDVVSKEMAKFRTG